jgi:hypothetical protein
VSAVKERLLELYEENYSHIDFIENMGGECDCAIHKEIEGEGEGNE